MYPETVQRTVWVFFYISVCFLQNKNSHSTQRETKEYIPGCFKEWRSIWSACVSQVNTIIQYKFLTLATHMRVVEKRKEEWVFQPRR